MNNSGEFQIPSHVGIIMDGNGRWAQKRNLPRIEGHQAGAQAVTRTVEACSEAGIRYLTLYAFSTENWKRPKTEIRRLMQLLDSFLKNRIDELNRHGIRLNAIGELGKLPSAVRLSLNSVIRATREHDRGVLTLALSYGARAEIAGAARCLARDVRQGIIDPDDITEEALSSRLYTADMPDPDLIIRTAGEMRLSNFMLWQASYAEFWSTETLWPDFSKEEFAEAIHDYGQRCRRFGGRPDA